MVIFQPCFWTGNYKRKKKKKKKRKETKERKKHALGQELSEEEEEEEEEKRDEREEQASVVRISTRSLYLSPGSSGPLPLSAAVFSAGLSCTSDLRLTGRPLVLLSGDPC